jgi:hypothetical protein
MTRVTQLLTRGAAILAVAAPCALGLAPAGWTQDAATPVPFDIKPKSCPNPLELNKREELPAGILGTSAFDATEIDPETVRLRLKGHGGDGVPPLLSTIEDVATPFVPFTGKDDPRDCNRIGRPDRVLDLSLKFDNQEVVQAVQDALLGVAFSRSRGMRNPGSWSSPM